MPAWPEEEEPAAAPTRRKDQRRQDQETATLQVRNTRQRSAEDFDLLIGFLGFWALVLFVVTAWLEITGRPALGWAMALLAVVLGLWGMVRLRRKLPPRVGRRR